MGACLGLFNASDGTFGEITDLGHVGPLQWVSQIR